MASATAMPVQAPLASAAHKTNSSIAQILQSDSVRRLLNQPNLAIHTVPRTSSPAAYRMIKPKPSIEKKNVVNGELQLPQKSEVSIQVINLPNKDQSEDENLLPSKYNGKSEILLVPIKRELKECGHIEDCESLICNVIVKQYEDDEGITPLISANISDDEEIDAPLTKHCENVKCDALSIDHDRCRRASIPLFSCDKLSMCSICETKFDSQIEFVNHQDCKKKNVYQFNLATPSDIFKWRMREREVQILEEDKMKQNSIYLDPIKGFNYAMEALKKNDELVVIPRMLPVQPKLSKQNYYNHSNNYYIKRNRGVRTTSVNRRLQAPEIDKELTSEMISDIILSCQNSIEQDRMNVKNHVQTPKQIKLSDHLNGGTVNVMDSMTTLNQSFINAIGLAAKSPSNISKQIHHPSGHSTPLKTNNNSSQQKHTQISALLENGSALGGNKLLLQNHPYKVVPIAQLKSEPSLLHQTQGMPKFCVVPDTSMINMSYKVVPIAEMKSEPSLLHKLQGMPKFCVVPDTSAASQPTSSTKKLIQQRKLSKKDKRVVPPLTLRKIPVKNTQNIGPVKFRPLPSIASANVRNVEAKMGNPLKAKRQKVRKRHRKKMLKKGKFRCTHCAKRFSSIDYCKIHIARHENNPGFFCRLCEKGFLNKYVMKKHLDSEHRAGEVRCEMCNCILPSVQELIDHMKTPSVKIKRGCSDCSKGFDTCYQLDYHSRKEHGFLICAICKRQIARTKMKKHLMLEHSISKNRIETGFEKLTQAPTDDELVSEDNLICETEEPVAKVAEPVVEEKKEEADCLARGRSARRRNSKEFFNCTVCERRFDNEKQYQIHLANNPMKFTVCPNCGKKFHRKSECNEHVKTCDVKITTPVQKKPRKRRSSLREETLTHSNEFTLPTSTGRKRHGIYDFPKSKKAKVTRVDPVKYEETKEKDTLSIEYDVIDLEEEDEPSDCLQYLKIMKKKNNFMSEKNEAERNKVSKLEEKILSSHSTQINSHVSTIVCETENMVKISRNHSLQVL
ncbi:hypothetical protein QAD02_022558 [Eretmocerus hayati]|uniref:Uncharacterized protein n=1 Tax=Eretmocerus hayati TaxID=131215 RepID=A0ACC2PVV5_9HYME|nr:hypothetical protein QAD02_022558 [Eretmocerus hayati]